MRMFITSKNKYISNDMKIFGTCSIPLIWWILVIVLYTIHKLEFFFLEYIVTWWSYEVLNVYSYIHLSCHDEGDIVTFHNVHVSITSWHLNGMVTFILRTHCSLWHHTINRTLWYHKTNFSMRHQWTDHPLCNHSTHCSLWYHRTNHTF